MPWMKVGQSETAAIVDFLLPREWECVTLVSRLLAGGRVKLPNPKHASVVKALDRDGHTKGIVYFSPYGLVLPVFDRRAEPADWNELEELHAKEGGSIQSVVGTARSVSLVADGLGLRHSVSIDYHLMRTDDAVLPADGIELPEVTIRKAEMREAESLLPLQEAYEREEVLIRQEYYDPKKSLAEIRTNISSQLYYVAEFRGSVVAKGGTNARGIGFDQIGGVYTKSEFRGKKIGHALVRRILEDIYRDGRRACLFVKKVNVPAVRLYSRLGFRTVDDFNIRYYRL